MVYKSSIVRKVHKWYETSMVRKVYGTKSLVPVQDTVITHTRFRLVLKSVTLDDLERPKRTLVEKIILRSPMHQRKIGHLIGNFRQDI